MKKNKLDIIFSAVILIFCSCNTTRTSRRLEDQDKELIKTLAYSKCMDYCIAKYVGKDSLNNSTQNLYGIMADYYGRFFLHTIYPIIDSLAKTNYLNIEKSRYPGAPVAESISGKTTYTLACLQFYKSRQLDSISNIFIRKMKDSVYSEPILRREN